MLEHTIALPGGVTSSVQAAGGTYAWSYPNLQGDDVMTSTASGTRIGVLAQYDPFGDPIDPTTHLIGTTSADDAVPTNTLIPASYGWEGSSQKFDEHQGGLLRVEATPDVW